MNNINSRSVMQVYKYYFKPVTRLCDLSLPFLFKLKYLFIHFTFLIFNEFVHNLKNR